MKMKFVYNSLFLIGSLIGFNSCTNELVPPVTDSININVVQEPEIYASSNGQYLVGTRSFDTAPNGDPVFERWQGDRSWSKPHDIIDSERDYVIQYLQENPNGGYKTLDIYNYIIQVVGNGGHIYDGDTPDHNGATHQVNASNEMNYCEIDGFFTQFNNTRMNGEDAILIKNVKATNATYHDSYGSTWEDHYAFYFITFPDDEQYGYMAGKTGLYLCYDFATWKESEKWGVSGDGIYDDWVIKLSPADGSTIEPPTNTNPGDSDDENETLIGKFKDNHIEVNLSIEERTDVEWLASHLSIHVRVNTDVEVFIPLPARYYCEVDDMAIVNKHQDDLMIHSGPRTSTYTISGNVVSMTVSFEADGIRVTTDGITQEVIDFCNTTYGDGLTFEVWNYMNLKVKDWSDNSEHGSNVLYPGQENEISVAELREYLNQSKIWFLDNDPALYVNAFMYQYGCLEEGEHTCGIFIDDCTVSPQNYFYNKETGNWLNGSPYNELYFNTNE